MAYSWLRGTLMKIGIMLRNIGDKGGIVVYTVNILNSLFRLDAINEYVLMYRFEQDRGRLGRFPNVSEKVLPGKNKLWWDQVTVPRFARREGIDVIYNPKLSIPLFTGSKTVWVMHGGEQAVVPHVFKRLDRMYFTVANRLYARRANAIITMTQLAKNDIVELMGADPRKTYVIHESYNERCGIMQPYETEAVKEKYGLPDRYLLFVGGITPLKNFGNLLRAYREVRDSYPHKLVAVGFKRWKFEGDLELVRTLGLQDDVIFPGFVEDEEIPAFYNMASLFVFPSLYEGFGIPALEAMACGCPVITSRTGCSREVTGDAAMLVDPYDPTDIAQAIGRCLSDERERARMREAGIERVKKFSWDKCARQTLRVFESVGGGSSQAAQGGAG